MNYIKEMPIILVALGIAATGWTQEVAVEKRAYAKHGIRVGIRNAPGVDEFERDVIGGTSITSVDPEDGIQVDVMYVRRHLGKDGTDTVGPMWGAGVFFNGSSGKDASGADYELTAFGTIGEGGIAVQLGEVVMLEAMPFIGLGGASQDISGFTSGSGGYFLYGFKGGVFFRIGDKMELGIEAGYSGFVSSGQIEIIGGNTYDFYLSGGGFQGGGVFVIKF